MRICRTLLGMLALAGGIFLSSARAQAQTTYYVDCAAAGGDGLSWGQAFPDLQDALAAAVDGDQIWVAACSLPPYAYRPVEPPEPPERDSSFQLASGVEIYGGFPPGGGDWADRDPLTHQTILSGDLNADDVFYLDSDCCQARTGETGCDDPACETLVCDADADCCSVEWDEDCVTLAAGLCGSLCTLGDNSDNSYHVVTANDADAGAVLDGFTITRGNADASFPRDSGAGMYITGGGPTINGCLIKENVADRFGAGLYVSSSSPTLTNCRFEDNSATKEGATYSDGGGVYNTDASSPTFTQCDFTNNSAKRDGGGMYNAGASNPTLTDCDFTTNSADTGGAGMYNTGYSDPQMHNCNFTGNTALDNGGGMHNASGSDPQLTECAFDGNQALNGGAIYNLQSSPQLTEQCTFTSNSAGAHGGAVFNAGGSTPTISDCQFSGNDAATNGGALYNDSSNPVLTDCTFLLNNAPNRGGAIYSTNAGPQLTSCYFEGNQTTGALGRGGALFNDTASPTLTRCTFGQNQTTLDGGAVYNDNNSNAVLAYCAFYKNIAGQSAGAVYNKTGSQAVLRDCLFSGNEAGLNGGAVSNNDCQPTVLNCTFSLNNAGSAGGGFYNAQSEPTLTNCILWGNTDAGGDVAAAQITTIDGTPTVTYSCLQDADPDDAGVFPGTGNIDDHPLFVDADGGDGFPGTLDDDLHLTLGSPCIDWGDPDFIPQPDESDLDGEPRIFNQRVDMGADEYSDCNDNGVADYEDIAAGTSLDCNENNVPDECDVAAGTAEDCNVNGVPDECDLAEGTSNDCDANEVPDECQTDCQPNDLPDVCDISGGTSEDCNGNGVPDECDAQGGVLVDTSFEVASAWPTGWSAAASLWHLTDQCPPAGATGGTRWAYFGLDDTCTFDTDGIVGGSLSTPTVFIPFTAESATLTYRSAYQGEGGISPYGFDAAYVAVNGTTVVDDVSAEGTQLDWTLRQVSLDAFIGQFITISFVFDSKDEFNNQGVGWLVDDVTFTYQGTDCQNDDTGDGIPDVCQLEDNDCNFNLVPDECEPDCQPNGIPDACDIGIYLTSEDCNFNEVPDECDADPSLTEATDWCFDAWYACPGQVYTGSTAEADSDGEASCQNEDSPDVWYKYAPDQDGTLTVSLCGSSFDTVLSIHQGCPGVVGNELACNNDSVACTPQSEVTLGVVGGGLYLVRVAGNTAADSGDFQLELTGPDCRTLNCNLNDLLDACDILFGTAEDCNDNDFPDTCDIDWGYEENCNGNHIPDSCEVEDLDCNANGVPDDCDVDPTDPDGDGEVSDDCQDSGAGDGVPDECQLFGNDCDDNGVPDECDPDSDGDETPDACDECPADPLKTYPGICGCGVADEPPGTDDDDDDGVPNCVDLCPDTPPDTPVDEYGCPADGACCLEAVMMCFDDFDGDLCVNGGGVFVGSGTFCTDADGDDVEDNCFDDCPGTPPGVEVDENGCPLIQIGACCVITGFCLDDVEQSDCLNFGLDAAFLGDGSSCSDPDADGDQAPDSCDDCPDDPDKVLPGQCGCGVPDTDTDGDNVEDCNDNCPNDVNPLQEDADGDSVGDACDNCPNEPALTDPDEPGAELTCDDGIDNDCDGMTDAADEDCGPSGCTCGDVNNSGGSVNLSDFGLFANCYGKTGPDVNCLQAWFDCSDLDGSGKVNLQDFGLFALWYGQESTQYPPNCQP